MNALIGGMRSDLLCLASWKKIRRKKKSGKKNDKRKEENRKPIEIKRMLQKHFFIQKKV